MKRTIALSLIFLLLLCPFSALAEDLYGFVIDEDVFYAMEMAFSQGDFTGKMNSVDLSETQTLVFDPTQTERLMPNLAVTVAEAEAFTADAEAVAATLGSLIETMQYLQDRFPETFFFNNEMVSPYSEDGLSYLVAETDIWLWPESLGAVLIPVCFYENKGGMLIDGIYLLEVKAPEENTLCYILYNDPRHVADYMMHVTINSEGSPFQRALAYWFVQNYYSETYDEAAHVVMEDSIGMVLVTVNNCNIREQSNTDSRVVARASRDDEYPVLSIADNGWYQIRYADGMAGYISPTLVEFSTIE